MTLAAELETAKAGLRHLVENQFHGVAPKGEAFVVDDRHKFVEDLESMEVCTRYMPITRVALDTGELLPGILPEVEKHLSVLRRSNAQWLANHRETRLALFRLNPSINSLRAIWIRKP